VTQEHDLEVKSRAIFQFLEDGHQVIVKIEFKAREITHKDLGFDILSGILDKVSEVGTGRKPSFMGKVLSCVIDPKN
jgi:translation initiation factor IF-3